MKDEIIEEIHQFREELAEKFDFDVRAMLKDLQKQQSNSDREHVSFAPKKLKKKVTAQNSEIKKAA